jgi:hypothetical protein
MDVELCHPGELCSRNRVILVALDVLPVERKSERGDDIRYTDDHIVLGAKSVTWELVGLTFESLGDALNQTFVVRGCAKQRSSPRKSRIVVVGGDGGLDLIEVNEGLEEDKHREMAEALGTKRVGMPTVSGATAIPEELGVGCNDPAYRADVF